MQSNFATILPQHAGVSESATLQVLPMAY